MQQDSGKSASVTSTCCWLMIEILRPVDTGESCRRDGPAYKSSRAFSLRGGTTESSRCRGLFEGQCLEESQRIRKSNAPTLVPGDAANPGAAACRGWQWRERPDEHTSATGTAGASAPAGGSCGGAGGRTHR